MGNRNMDNGNYLEKTLVKLIFFVSIIGLSILISLNYFITKKSLEYKNEKFSHEINRTIDEYKNELDFIAGLPISIDSIKLQSQSAIRALLSNIVKRELFFDFIFVKDQKDRLFSYALGTQGYTVFFHDLKQRFILLENMDVIEKEDYIFIISPITVDNSILGKIVLGINKENLVESTKNLLGISHTISAPYLSKQFAKINEVSFSDTISDLWFTNKKEVLLSLIILSSIIIVLSFFLRRLILPFSLLLYKIKEISFQNTNMLNTSSYPRIFRPFILEINLLILKIIEINDDARKLAEEAASQKTATQIAHDIRSPLTALQSVNNSEFFKNNPSYEIINKSIERINQIASNLLRNEDSSKITKDVRKHLAQYCVKQIITEKQYEFSSKGNNIAFQISDLNNYFIQINETDLFRLLSNLINNAFEAIESNVPLVSVIYKELQGEIQIIVKDNGKGIPEEMKGKIFERGFTNKVEGNGLGLFQVKESVEQYNGKICVNSQVGIGTEFIITFPATSTPIWFIDEVKLRENIFIIDDDYSIHELWKRKMSHLNKIKVSYMNSLPDSLQTNLEQTYFIDHDFGKDKTGLDFIIENKLQDCAYLVTSKFDEDILQSECIKNNVKMIPKFILAELKLIQTNQNVVLIDNDELVRQVWKMTNPKLHVFHSVPDFLENASQFNLEDIVYIDSELDNDMKGEIESKAIYEMGFKNIYLTTGYEKSHFELPYWIKDVKGKSPPVELL